MKEKAYIGIDIGSISTKGVVIDQNNTFLAESYLWTQGNPTQATKDVLHALKEQIDTEKYSDCGCRHDRQRQKAYRHYDRRPGY